jgi:hypothetical protein
MTTNIYSCYCSTVVVCMYCTTAAPIVVQYYCSTHKKENDEASVGQRCAVA